jgi:hypothetical protein
MPLGRLGRGNAGAARFRLRNGGTRKQGNRSWVEPLGLLSRRDTAMSPRPPIPGSLPDLVPADANAALRAAGVPVVACRTIEDRPRPGRRAMSRSGLESEAYPGGVALYPVVLHPYSGEQVEQQNSCLRRPLVPSSSSPQCPLLRRADVCASLPGPPSRKHASPSRASSRITGVWGMVAPLLQSRPGFSEQQPNVLDFSRFLLDYAVACLYL